MSGMGCVIVEGDSFTAQMQCVDGQMVLCEIEVELLVEQFRCFDKNTDDKP